MEQIEHSKQENKSVEARNVTKEKTKQHKK